MRPINSFTSVVGIILALFLAVDDVTSLNGYSVTLIALFAFFATGHAMVHNDIIDFEIDKINSPHRILPSEQVTLRQARIWSVVLFIVTIVLSLGIDYILGLSVPFTLFWLLFNTSIFYAYNLYLKKNGLLGNVIVAFEIWSLFIYADIIINNELTLRTQSIGLYGFFLNWGREIFKDIIDLEGDKIGGKTTIAVRYGIKTCGIVGSLILGVAVLWTLPLIFIYANTPLLQLYLILFDLFLLWKSFQLIRNLDKDNIYQFKSLLLKLMLFTLFIIMIDHLLS